MANVKRGSQHVLVAILETLYGTTPATPAMTDVPIVRVRKNKSMGSIRSGQIRSHPFTDRLLPGAITQDLEIGTELQYGNHDFLLQMLAGEAWAADVLKMGDALLGATIESQMKGSTAAQYDQFVGAFVNRAEFSISAEEDAPIGVTYGLGALTSELDSATSLATTTPASAVVDPFVYINGLTEIDTVVRPVTSITFRAERAVNPLRVIGSANAREQVPGDFTLTGSLTIPLEDAIESARLEAFISVPIHVRVGNPGLAVYIDFLMHQAKYTTMGRSVEGRGALMQEIEFECQYDGTAGTVMTISRSAP